ncbi:MAG: hypothetical protein ACKO26_04790, partial [Planctomycetota bacterium]
PAQGLEHPSGSRSGPSSILDRQVLPFWIPDLVIPSIGTFDPIGAGILSQLFQPVEVHNRHLGIILCKAPIFS